MPTGKTFGIPKIPVNKHVVDTHTHLNCFGLLLVSIVSEMRAQLMWRTQNKLRVVSEIDFSLGSFSIVIQRRKWKKSENDKGRKIGRKKPISLKFQTEQVNGVYYLNLLVVCISYKVATPE